MEKLKLEKLNGYCKVDDDFIGKMTDFCEGYKDFLSMCKTERECASYIETEAINHGFKALDEYNELKPGDRVYVLNRSRAIMLAVIGKEPIENGVNIVAAHIDSPRLDIKQNPIIESDDIAFLKTHYYGGIKKYQWVTMPLSIHGVVIKKGGEKIDVVIGEDKDDPVFCITDLLPHLGHDQMEKTASKVIEGEKLNILIGSKPIKNDEKSCVKDNILKLLNQKYGICENDLLTADLEVVPAFCAKDVGFDRSMIGSYGQDDRVCAYTAYKGILDVEMPQKSAIVYLVDKEEIGSCDSTGMKSTFFADTLAELCFKADKLYSDLKIRRALKNSFCLSADVTAAVDPNYDYVNEKNNSAYMNYGVALMKYSGARGKSGTNEATAETVRYIVDIFNENNVIWQTAELGKVDEGGGGTVAQYFAILNVDVIDCGVPILSMHSPFEISGKLDVFMAYKAYKSLLGR